MAVTFTQINDVIEGLQEGLHPATLESLQGLANKISRLDPKVSDGTITDESTYLFSYTINSRAQMSGTNLDRKDGRI
jgi:hypothetical protein